MAARFGVILVDTFCGCAPPTKQKPNTHTPLALAHRLRSIEVGTETGVDRSKSVASFLLQWLHGQGSGGGHSGGGGGGNSRGANGSGGGGGADGGGAGGGAAEDDDEQGEEHFAMFAGAAAAQVADNVHGCYGGTAALLHACDWVAGPSWDGRLALAVATDIAVYEEGSPARATGAYACLAAAARCC